MRTAIITVAAIVVLAVGARAGEFHVATQGNDSNPGTQAAPLGKIRRAAELAQPGDTITIEVEHLGALSNPCRAEHVE